jgi:hypothetical protein
MSTHDYIVDNQNGANFRSDLNNALAAIVSNNSSATAPTTTYAFMLWADTASDLLKQRNAADSAWINILTLSTGAPLGTLSSSLLSGALPAIDGSALTGIVSVPSGLISMWSGLVGAIPSGWVICDGNNSTPNLTDKFIKAAATAGGTGGSATTGATTLSTAQIPSHSHLSSFLFSASGSSPSVNEDTTQMYQWNKGTWGTRAFLISGNSGGGGSHTHPQSEPVYFALIFIMKT